MKREGNSFLLPAVRKARSLRAFNDLTKLRSSQVLSPFVHLRKQELRIIKEKAKSLGLGNFSLGLNLKFLDAHLLSFVRVGMARGPSLLSFFLFV